MGELAEVYGLDQEKARTIGILHDAAKDLSSEQQQQIMEAGEIQIHHECERDYVFYLHAPVGAYFVHSELGISDPLILDAILTHTYYGSSPYFNHPLCWCLRFADIIEPTRNWDGEKLLLEGARRLRELAYAGNMEKGAFLEIGTIIRWYEEKDVPVHPNMRRVKGELARRLELDDSFLELDIR